MEFDPEPSNSILSDSLEELSGTRDIKKGYERLGMLLEWQEEQDRCN